MKATLPILLTLFTLTSCKIAPVKGELDSLVASPSHSLTINQFQDLLFTEIHDEVHSLRLVDDSDGRRVLEDRKDALPTGAQDLWEHIIEHGWSYVAEMQIADPTVPNPKRSLHTGRGTSTFQDSTFPFLLCNKSAQHTSGAQRLQTTLEDIGAIHDDLITVYNGDQKTCYHISTTHNVAKKLISKDEPTGGVYAIVPMTDIMKISVNTMAEVSQDYWPPKNLQSHDTDMSDSWERLVRVAFVTGERTTFTEEHVISKANAIIEHVQSLGKRGAEKRRRNLQTVANDYFDSPTSISDVFSLTSTRYNSRRLNASSKKGRTDFWAQSLERGLEAEHGCETMFRTIHIRPQYDFKGFDIVLNPSQPDNDRTENMNASNTSHDMDIESSASNTHCITSFIMALSTHPSVLNVEVDTPITSDDYDTQWITQSHEPDDRPLTEARLTGQGQIVSIIDSGCQTDHRFFGPTNANTIDNWDMNQAKIVKYDTTNGDDKDVSRGHGTSVAGVVAGKASSGDNEANGIAEDAKLHIFDMSTNGGFYNTRRLPYAALKSMYNNGNGAKIANASWSTRYSKYRTSCRMYDDLLYGEFQDVVFVASAGNDGRNPSLNTSQMNTIGNPAACKNTLAGK